MELLLRSISILHLYFFSLFGKIYAFFFDSFYFSYHNASLKKLTKKDYYKLLDKRDWHRRQQQHHEQR